VERRHEGCQRHARRAGEKMQAAASEQQEQREPGLFAVGRARCLLGLARSEIGLPSYTVGPVFFYFGTMTRRDTLTTRDVLKGARSLNRLEGEVELL
jgi:hypothetical protein